MRISDWSSDVCSSDLASEAFCDLRDREKLLVTGGATAPTGSLRHRHLLHQSPAFTGAPDGRWKNRNRFAEFFLSGPHPMADGRALSASKQRDARSEEHTSELQSLMRISYAVFCLKKKKKHPPNRST